MVLDKINSYLPDVKLCRALHSLYILQKNIANLICLCRKWNDPSGEYSLSRPRVQSQPFFSIILFLSLSLSSHSLMIELTQILNMKEAEDIHI